MMFSSNYICEHFLSRQNKTRSQNVFFSYFKWIVNILLQAAPKTGGKIPNLKVYILLFDEHLRNILSSKLCSNFNLNQSFMWENLKPSDFLVFHDGGNKENSKICKSQNSNPIFISIIHFLSPYKTQLPSNFKRFKFSYENGLSQWTTPFAHLRPRFQKNLNITTSFLGFPLLFH